MTKNSSINDDSVDNTLIVEAVNPFADGVACIKKYLKNLSATPGVYRMYNADNVLLYVGKARHLPNRVRSYTNRHNLSTRIQHMVAATSSMQFIHTHTEAEALLLEANLIKQEKPVYNIMLRDDKSYPMILILHDTDFPQIIKHRGRQNIKGKYFGPFASTQAVNHTLNLMERIFLLRNCSDNIFKQRTKPCLQYHIKRCSAPCVNYISKEDYAKEVQYASDFLEGKSPDIKEEYQHKMHQASEQLLFEKAAQYRDRIIALAQLQQHQDINIAHNLNADIFALKREGATSCVALFFFRHGQHYGNRYFYPKHKRDDNDEVIIQALISQFYLDKTPPKHIITSVLPESTELLEEALSINTTYKTSIIKPHRGQKKQLLDYAMHNAIQYFNSKILQTTSHKNMLASFAELLHITAPITRVEIYDNSHIQGKHRVGAMVVANDEGFDKKAYRTFNFDNDLEDGINDDYAMMAIMLSRRFKRQFIDNDSANKTHQQFPDLIILDGGKGQLNVVLNIMDELNIMHINIIAVSKGKDRHAGKEIIHLNNGDEIALAQDDPRQFFIQRLRDEAHRFAIGKHRKKRSRAISHNPLIDIDGIGQKKRQALMRHFGSVESIKQSGIKDLILVDGISQKQAEIIYNFFHQ